MNPVLRPETDICYLFVILAVLDISVVQSLLFVPSPRSRFVVWFHADGSRDSLVPVEPAAPDSSETHLF